MRPRISIRGSVRPSVRRSVGWSVGNACMYVIREAQEHHRKVELHIYRKVCLLVRPSVSWDDLKLVISIPGR